MSKTPARGFVKNCKKTIISLIYPVRCPVCDLPARDKKRGICPQCRNTLEYTPGPNCIKCGKHVERDDQAFCADCRKRVHRFEQGVALYDYRSASASLYRFKYAGRAEYGHFFGNELANRFGKRITEWGIQAIVPVPIHSSRRRVRGYNQAEEIADALGERMEIPVIKDWVIRAKRTIPQKELGPEERQNNVKKAFIIGRSDVKLETIVIIDDIYTTGSTVDAMAQLFQKAGVRKIYVITLAIGRGL